MNRLFYRDRQRESKTQTSGQLHIAVTGLSRSAGTTFVAVSLAFYFRDLGKQATFVQGLRGPAEMPLLYDSVAMDQRFLHRPFFHHYQKAADHQPLNGQWNKEEGIFWILPCREDGQGAALTELQTARLLAAADGDVCIYDLEADYWWEAYLQDMDLVVVIADPMPSKLIAAAERFKRLKKIEFGGTPCVWMVNKDNGGINRKEVKRYLKTGEIYWIPLFPQEAFYCSEYTCRFIWENEEIKREMLEIFTKVSQFRSSL